MADENKTEQATPKKKKDERKKGNIFQSKDITTAVSIFVAFFALKLLMPYLYNQISEMMQQMIVQAGTMQSLELATAHKIIAKSLLRLLMIAGPIMILCLLAGVITTLAQTKMLFAVESIKFKFSKLNPIEGIKRIISLKSFVELLKNLFKIIIIGLLIYFSILGVIQKLPKLIEYNLINACVFIGDQIMILVIKIGVVFLFIAVLDYYYQRWEHEKKLRMTKHEVKQEYKQMEGDPQIRGKRKQLQQQMAMGRMMSKVPAADVIIRNPTHFAVALKYDGKSNRAPIVIAKGQDHLALKIIQIAQANGVAISENKPLARAIYHTTDLEREISPEYYQPVAEILAWVYSLKKGVD